MASDTAGQVKTDLHYMQLMLIYPWDDQTQSKVMVSNCGGIITECDPALQQQQTVESISRRFIDLPPKSSDAWRTMNSRSMQDGKTWIDFSCNYTVFFTLLPFQPNIG